MSDDAERERWRKIAAIALNRAVANDMPGAAAYLKRLNNGPGLLVAIKGFADTYLARMHPEHQPGTRTFALRWMAIETGDVNAAEQMPPSLRWAGQLIGARANDDEATFMALLCAPSEGAELGDGIMALLNVVATSLNNADAVRAAEATIDSARP